jgi:BirA family transcriptional regulator, biotin operon repressor / biotin---[acetyl-CoA-carboxylase] ligase
MTRTAISPRFAISTFSNTSYLSSTCFECLRPSEHRGITADHRGNTCDHPGGHRQAPSDDHGALWDHHTGTHRKLSATPQNAWTQEPSSQFEVLSGPAGTRFTEVRRFEVIDSTNRYLIDEALSGASEGLVAVADYQTAGRGRLGRRWVAPPGSNLLASVLLRPALSATQLHLVTAVMGLAASDACNGLVGVEPTLKWPNDLLVGDRKLAGILAESVQDAVVVGLGLNVRWPERHSERPASAQDRDNRERREHGEPRQDREQAITSLWLESGGQTDAKAFEPIAVLQAVLENLEWRVGELFGPEGRERQASEYRMRCGTLGRHVHVSLGERTFDGTATGITPEGRLEVESSDGMVEIAAGDVFHID